MTGAVMAIAGAGGEIVSISDATPHGNSVSPANATATYSLTNAGDIVHGDGAGTDQGDWISPKRNFGSYEVRATETAGTVTTGTVGSWLALSTTRTWTKTRTSDSPGTDSVTLTVEIRKAGVTLDTATITIEAEVV